ncbi:hypothetical protein [Salinispora pacifica]
MVQPVVFSIQRDGQGGEHDGQVRFDRFAVVVVDRSGGQVCLAHPERLFDLQQPAVGADELLRVGVRDVGDVALDPG